MVEFLDVIVDKFTFRVATDRWYNADGVWALPDGDGVRVGMSDYAQQSAGDVAFASVRAVGTRVGVGDDVADIETIKVNLGLASPVAGEIVATNAALGDTPDLINTDPYGAGWLVRLDVGDWEAARAGLLDAAQYLERVRQQAEEEARRA